MAIIKCPECGHQISEKATICPSCGVEIDGKITRCVHCGEVYFKDDGLCPNCHRPYHTPAVMDNEENIEENLDKDFNKDFNKPSSTHSASAVKSTYKKPESSVPITPIIKKEMKEEIKEEVKEEKETIEATAVATSSEEESLSEAENLSDTEFLTEDEVLSDDEISMEEPEVVDEPKEIDTKDEFLIRTQGNDGYIDTESDDDEPPADGESTDENRTHKHNYIPLIVSLAITAVIAAICLYFYNESKMEREIQAFNVAMDSGDTEAMRDFLLNYTDATDAHKAAINEAIAKISKQEQDLSLCMANRDKDALLRFVHDYPDSPYRSKILAMVDTIDWEDACKTNNKAAYDKYIAQHADGAFIKEAKDKVSVKKVEATAEDDAMARSLFREFFLSVNGNDAARLTPNLSDQITSFMSTPNPSIDDIVGWMKRQHGEGVASVIWKLNGDYKIQKREQGGSKDYTIDFTAKKTVVHSDGRATSEHFKIKSNVNGNGKISSMEMTKYTPPPTESTSSSSSSSSSTNKPSSSSSSSKPSTSSSSSKPTSSSSSSKPSTSSSSSKPGTSSSSSKPSTSSSSSKPSSSSKSSTSSSSSKPSSSSSSSKPSGSSSSSKPSTSSNAAKDTKSQKKQ